ncbi:MAG: NAD(P)H-binding protein [Pseudomonadota bacterium]
MSIAVIGASRGIGRETVETALNRGQSVRAFSRNAEALDRDDPNLEQVSGDAREPADVARAIDGASAVIMTLGIRERLAMIWEEETLFSTSTAVALAAMKDAGVKRLVVVTGLGTSESADALSSLERIGFRFFLSKPYEDKARQEVLVRSSETDWTIVRPTILTNTGPSGRYRVLVNPREWRNGLISRADVADFLVSAATQNTYVHQAVVLAR